MSELHCRISSIAWNHFRAATLLKRNFEHTAVIHVPQLAMQVLEALVRMGHASQSMVLFHYLQGLDHAMNGNLFQTWLQRDSLLLSAQENMETFKDLSVKMAHMILDLSCEHGQLSPVESTRATHAQHIRFSDT